MISNNPFRSFTQPGNMAYAAAELAKHSEAVARRERAGLKGSGDENSFASKLKQADEYLASGESNGATDSVGIILRQMDDPKPGEAPVTKEVFHNGAKVVVTKDARLGNSITIGGSANPDWIQVSTSVGTVNIDLNDTASLMKCLDMFSPEDMTAIMRKIIEVKQAREAQRQIDGLGDELIKDKKDED